MPILIIDDQKIDVPAGTKVIDAAERLGIMIPRFCYHPALGSVGACRVCAVKVVEGYCPGIQMSCMIDVADGMVVSTTDAEAVAFRKSVIEWLMANHPHDCPVCDEGGHCLLQEITVSGGHGQRRYTGSKRTHLDQDLGPLVQHEMNRCIQCYRCTRYYREYSGYSDLGVMGIGSRVYFGRRRDGVLKSPFSGNLIDVCPTGVYTDKPSRFMGRRWDFERSESICTHCSLGCCTILSARYREIVRQEARFSPSVNGHFICDRGRFGFRFTRDTKRPRSPLIGSGKTDVDSAIRHLAKKIETITEKSGPEAVALAGSHRSSLETLAAARRICRLNRWTGPAFFQDEETAGKLQTTVSGLDSDLAVSLSEVAMADLVLAVGIDPVCEAPMLAMSMRQAQRQGANIIILDPRPVDLPMPFLHLPVTPDQLVQSLQTLILKGTDRAAAESNGAEAVRFYDALKASEPTGTEAERMDPAAEALKACRRPVILCGTDLPSREGVGLSAALSKLLRPEKNHAGLFYTMPGANSFGAALAAGECAAFDQVLHEIEAGRVKVLILVENDPMWYFPDPERVESAMDRLELLVVVDYLATPLAERADLFIPSTTVFETGGIYINQEGRVQQAKPAFTGGRAVAETGGGSHPPRTFRRDIPGGEPVPAHDLLRRMAGMPASPMEAGTIEEVQTLMAEIRPELPPISATSDAGIRISGAASPDTIFAAVVPEASASLDFDYTLVTAEAPFGTEELSRHSTCLQQREEAPALFIHETDAAFLDLADGDRVELVLEKGTIEIAVRVKRNMAKGVLVLPRHRQVAWQRAGSQPVGLLRERIRKIGMEVS